MATKWWKWLGAHRRIAVYAAFVSVPVAAFGIASGDSYGSTNRPVRSIVLAMIWLGGAYLLWTLAHLADRRWPQSKSGEPLLRIVGPAILVATITAAMMDQALRNESQNFWALVLGLLAIIASASLVLYNTREHPDADDGPSPPKPPADLQFDWPTVMPVRD